jgi:hypothetical protein
MDNQNSGHDRSPTNRFKYPTIGAGNQWPSLTFLSGRHIKITVASEVAEEPDRQALVRL